MKSKSIVRVLAAIGIFASSVTVAQAGGGAGAGASLKAFFQCQSIDGENLGESVSTTAVGDNGGDVLGNFKVGAGILLCRQVDVKDSSGDIINGTLESEFIKCYAASTKGPKAASSQVVLEDNFRSTETVNVSPSVQMICGPTIIK